ncbi:hypothetical protein COS86_02185 [Candidatus Bathyarchaeota archaeon CG07_land_8_20_14_0_80_47_9]|nr:MAG: hypothetical protein COS86_02185 [Candidatus Bathyarchaeota archaeon CG07_land_8_20_14_0_80_47_9]
MQDSRRRRNVKKHNQPFFFYPARAEQLAGLVKICGFLLQTKVYLFWKRGLEITVMAKLVD